MKKGKRKKQISLSRKIFQYLIITNIFSLLILGSFWIKGKVDDHEKELLVLKNSYSETKKAEIKNKILTIKDNIRWIQSHPFQPISKLMNGNINKLESWALNSENMPDDLLNVIKDSVQKIGIPFFIINKQSELIYSNYPFEDDHVENLTKELYLYNVAKKKNAVERSIYPVFTKSNPSDSILSSIIYINTNISSGYKLISIATVENFDEILQNYCLDSLSRVRYEKDEYIFINTSNGKALASNGQINKPPVDIFASGDTAWQRIYKVEQLTKIRQGGIFYTYSFQKITALKTSLKTSFFSYLPEWDWIIGTGYYEDDINKIIEIKKNELNADMRSKLIKAILLLIIPISLSYLLVLFFSKRMAKNIRIFNNFFTKAAGERILIDQSQVSYKEFENLADTANLMVEESIKIDSELRLSEEKYRLLFEHNPASMLIYERGTFKILAVNEAFQNNYGYSSEEILRMKLNDLYPAEEKSPVLELSRNLYGHAYAGEWHHIKKDGSIITIIATSHDITYTGHEARIAVITDISDRKDAEEKIKFREQQLSLIYSNVFDAIYYLSVENDNSYRFLSVNHAFLKITGFPENVVLNKKVEDIFQEPSLSIVIKNFNIAVREKRTVLWEETSKFPTGEKIGLFSITPLFDSNSKCINLVGTVRDITERKKAEQELKLHRDNLQELVNQRTEELEKEKEKAQSADYLKTAFLASMSHELRTPLNSIIGFTGILMKERPGPLNDEQKKQLGMVQESARHLLSLINDVLDISKIEAGQLKLNITKFSLPEVIIKAIETNKPLAEKRNLDISVSINDDIKDIISDKLRVYQILINLVNNAIKFTEAGNVSIRCYSVGELIKIEVKDTGIGIEKDKTVKLFKPFMQIDTGLTRKHEGTGLGLSICKKLTDMLNGEIEVESEFGTGSTFTLTLPINNI